MFLPEANWMVGPPSRSNSSATRTQETATGHQNNPKSMPDFFQTGAVATLHRLGKPEIPRLEQELEEFSKETPIALVLPCHVRELGTPALRSIVRELKNVRYLKQIVVGVDGAN